MESSIDKFNGLDGVINTRSQIKSIICQAVDEGRNDIVIKLKNILKKFPEYKKFELDVTEKAYGEIMPHLNGIDLIAIDDDENGLGKPVSSEEIYQYITDMVIKLIESDKTFKWERQYKTNYAGVGNLATNYDSKKAYRGINSMLLNFIYPLIHKREFDNPYFMTFNQIEKAKGKLKKGSKGYRIVYFTQLYTFGDPDKKIAIRTYNKSKFIAALKKSKTSLLNDFSPESIAAQSSIPILKYYNIFNADDITGIDWQLKKEKEKTKVEKLEIAEAIVNSMPNAPKITHAGGGGFYSLKLDVVNVPPISEYKTKEGYYSTLFHELVHSTKHKKRLNDPTRGGLKFGDKEYSREELVAELGAVFLNSEAGNLLTTINNNAAYLKSWRNVLLRFLKEDNKFFFRASSKSQAAADYILDRDKKGVPGYIDVIIKSNKIIEKKNSSIKKKTVKPKFNKKTKQIALFGKGNKELTGLGFVSAATNLEAPKDVFHLAGSIGDFIQDVQPHQALILIKGTKHTSKSQLAMQVAEGFSLTGREVAYIDYEQGGLESKDTRQSLERNTTPRGRERIHIKGYVESPMEELQAIIKFVDVIVADSVTDLGISADQLNYLRKTYPKVIWCFISQVKENGAMYGGNKMAHNPTAIIECHPNVSPEGRYATLEKNRGNDLNICYAIYKQQAFVFKDQKTKYGVKTVRKYMK